MRVFTRWYVGQSGYVGAGVVVWTGAFDDACVAGAFDDGFVAAALDDVCVAVVCDAGDAIGWVPELQAVSARAVRAIQIDALHA